ncbi:hypothetical protein ACTMU2_11050 [Cupriavidus basilensis]
MKERHQDSLSTSDLELATQCNWANAFRLFLERRFVDDAGGDVLAGSSALLMCKRMVPVPLVIAVAVGIEPIGIEENRDQATPPLDHYVWKARVAHLLV